jgi:hypothetical protein
MEETNPAPLADDGEHGAIPDDQPIGGPAGPGDENMQPRPITTPGEEGPREPSPESSDTCDGRRARRDAR